MYAMALPDGTYANVSGCVIVILSEDVLADLDAGWNLNSLIDQGRVPVIAEFK